MIAVVAAVVTVAVVTCDKLLGVQHTLTIEHSHIDSSNNNLTTTAAVTTTTTTTTYPNN